MKCVVFGIVYNHKKVLGIFVLNMVRTYLTRIYKIYKCHAGNNNSKDLTSDQSNMAKAASNPFGYRDSRLYYGVLCVPTSLHPKQDLDPFSHVCTATAKLRDR